MVSLSATVSNAEEFGDWLSEVRGANDIIVEERRPVPLFQHVMVGNRLFDLFADPDEYAAGDRATEALGQPAAGPGRARRLAPDAQP